MELLTATKIRELARRHGLNPSKALGQNFVIDPNTIRRIVRLAEVTAGDRVLEVGAGLGTLTLGLADLADHVVAVELDKFLIPALREVMGAADNVRIVNADAMDLDFEGLGCDKMVSNLPYNVATPLVAKLLSKAPSISTFVFMVQKEVGARMVAGPGSRTYGGISVRVAYHCEAKVLGTVPASVFWPAPKVASALVWMKRRPHPRVAIDESLLMRVVKAAFSQRRKTATNSIASSLGLPVSTVEGAFVTVDIDPMRRAESLGLEEFAKLAAELS